MEITIVHLHNGAEAARGLTVVIDVFRAFSTACYIMNNGAEKIIPVGSVEEAYQWKKENPGVVLVGERNERKCEGFDFGNSPTHLEHIDFSGKTVVLTTSAGTRGLVSATKATRLLTGSFVNAEAIAQYIEFNKPEAVTLVAMGYNAERPSQEDTFCAEWIKSRLEGTRLPLGPMVEVLRYGDGARLLDPANHLHSPASDFDLCLDLNRFGFVLEAGKNKEGYMELQKINRVS